MLVYPFSLPQGPSRPAGCSLTSTGPSETCGGYIRAFNILISVRLISVIFSLLLALIRLKAPAIQTIDQINIIY